MQVMGRMHCTKTPLSSMHRIQLRHNLSNKKESLVFRLSPMMSFTAHLTVKHTILLIASHPYQPSPDHLHPHTPRRPIKPHCSPTGPSHSTNHHQLDKLIAKPPSLLCDLRPHGKVASTAALARERLPLHQPHSSNTKLLPIHPKHHRYTRHQVLAAALLQLHHHDHLAIYILMPNLS